MGAMPNTNPPITDAESFALASQIAHSKARCDYGIFLGASAANPTLTAAVAPQAFALKMYLEDTYLFTPWNFLLPYYVVKPFDDKQIRTSHHE